MEKLELVWMTLPTGEEWSDGIQIPLGEITWSAAVKIAKAQKFREVRLSLSEGFVNQGYYIFTDIS